ncbi:MAG: APC family permease [Actinomycetota bacterium]|nr:APC family permease [Actinomycetota bacterium]
MPSLTDIPKRLLVGRPVRSDRLGETLLPKRLALPIFASDPLSSVTYATQEMLVVLTLGGVAFLTLTPWLAAGVVLLLVTVVASYRQLVRAYPSGGGDYEVATTNLGRTAGIVVASALLIDYVLTVAVSVSAGVDNIIAAFPETADLRVAMALGFVALLTALNLRGVKESGRVFAVPTYGFVAGVLLMIVTGLVRWAVGDPPVAESAAYRIEPHQQELAGLMLVFFVLRAFSVGCTALTGVEAIANGVPAFQKPKSRNAATTLALMGGIAMTMFSGITALAVIADVHYVEDPGEQLAGFPAGEVQRTVIGQLSAAVFGEASIGFFYVQAMAAGILILAANTAYNGFPLLGSILAQDRLLPRQLHTRGDRLVYSNGILVLAGSAGLLIYAFDANVSRLINLYVIGVFTAFTIGQSGMVRHWTTLLASGTLTAEQARDARRSRVINATGAALTGVVLVMAVLTKFTRGAWLVIVTMPVLFLLMKAISRHYHSVGDELAPHDEPITLPSRNHVVVLVSKVHAPTLRAVAFARAMRPDTLVALTVDVEGADTRALQEEWERLEIPVDLVVLDSPYREITRPVLDYVSRIRRQSPRDVVTVLVPEYVVGHWWEQLLHNQSALRLKTRLRLLPGVMITSVPYQLRSSVRAKARPERPSPGDVRRGESERASVQNAADLLTAQPAPPLQDRAVAGRRRDRTTL